MFKEQNHLFNEHGHKSKWNVRFSMGHSLPNFLSKDTFKESDTLFKESKESDTWIHVDSASLDTGVLVT